MRKTPIPAKRVGEASQVKQKKKEEQPRTVPLKQPQQWQRRTPSKSPSLEPYSRSISRETISGRLSFNKNLSKHRHEHSSDVVNTKEQTFITHEESSNRSGICGEDFEGRSRHRSHARILCNKIYPEKSFFNSLESRNQKSEAKSAARISTKKKLKQKVHTNTHSKKKEPKDHKESRDHKDHKDHKQHRESKEEKHTKGKPKKSLEKATPRVPLRQKVKVPENRDYLVQENHLKYQKKITEVSEQQLECSIGRPMSMCDKYSNPKHTLKLIDFFTTPKKDSRKAPDDAVYQLLHSIKLKLLETMPGLSSQERRLLTAVIFVQRSWRQKKVKRIIGNYLAPRAHTPRVSIISDSSLGTSNEVTPYQLQIPKAHISPQVQLFDAQQYKDRPHIKQKIERFVDCFKEAKDYQQKSKKLRFLHLGESLSDSCFVDKLHKKLESLETKVDRIKEAKNKLLFSRVSPALDIHVLASSALETSTSGLETSQKISQFQHPEDQKKQQKESFDVASSLLTNILDHIDELSAAHSKEKPVKAGLPRIRTSRKSIDKYFTDLLSYISTSPYVEVILDNLNKPLGIRPVDLLKFLRASEDGQEGGDLSLEYDESEFSTGSVLPEEIFLEFQEQIEKSQHSSEEKYKNFLESIQRIHNKALIDCFSEVLDDMRVFGLVGKPFPWQKTFLKNSQPTTQQNLDCKLRAAKKSVLRLASFKLGSRQGNQELSLLVSIEDQFSKSEEEWIRLDEEKLEINLGLSAHVVQHLMGEVCLELLAMVQ